MNGESEPIGRRIAENILNAAKEQTFEATELHAPNDPYYWEDEYSEEDFNNLSLLTILRHNAHYVAASAYNWCTNIGFSILNFFGWTGSDYDWIEHELKREEHLEAIIREEEEEERKLREEQRRAMMRRKTNAIEKGAL